MANSITQDAFERCQCYDYSIQTLSNGADILILMCRNTEGSNQLNELINTNNFDLRVVAEQESGDYSLIFEFIDNDLAFKLTTGRNEDTYPPVVKLKEGKIKFITTGIWGEDSPQGRLCEYHSRILRLGKLEINECFQQAIGVQFAAGRNEDEPSVVVLLYNDWDHIFAAEANDAYNNLLEKSKFKPLLGITKNTDETVDLRIWDTLIDLDIRCSKLPFKEEELEKFLAANEPTSSFAFAIGFPQEDGPYAGLANTKKGEISLITLRGYTVKY